VQPRRIHVRHRLAFEQSHQALPPRRFWEDCSRDDIAPEVCTSADVPFDPEPAPDPDPGIAREKQGGQRAAGGSASIERCDATCRTPARS
jgi:hypothetical protein